MSNRQRLEAVTMTDVVLEHTLNKMVVDGVPESVEVAVTVTVAVELTW